MIITTIDDTLPVVRLELSSDGVGFIDLIAYVGTGGAVKVGYFCNAGLALNPYPPGLPPEWLDRNGYLKIRRDR